MHEWVIPAIILGVVTLALVAAAVVADRREAAQRKAMHITGFPGSPAAEVPQTWVPFLTAAALVTLGLALLTRNVFGVAPYSDSMTVGGCSATFTVPAEARTGQVVVATLASRCANVLTSSVLYANGSDKSSAKIVRAAGKAADGMAYWYLTVTAGSQYVVLFARLTPRLRAGSLTLAADKVPAAQHADIQLGSCKVTLDGSAVQPADFHTVDVASACTDLIGSEKLLVDGAAGKATMLGSPSSDALGPAVDRWLIKGSSGPQRVDVIVDDDAQLTAAVAHEVRGKTPLGLGDAASFATSTLGSLTTLAGLIAGVLALFRRR